MSQTREQLASPGREQEPNPLKANCPSRELIGVLGSKWVLLVIPLLREGPKRNADLLRSIEGVSQRMLTQTLRDLEAHRLVHRHDFSEIPPRVEYTLTPLGASLAERLQALDDWVRANAYVATSPE